MFTVFNDIIAEMRLVYQHDQRPWMLGFSGGKDSTLLCQLVFEMLHTLKPEERTKKVCCHIRYDGREPHCKGLHVSYECGDQYHQRK